jgi:hypothetical protein
VPARTEFQPAFQGPATGIRNDSGDPLRKKDKYVLIALMPGGA